jgi:hypothetical protein
MILRLEGLALFALATAGFAWMERSWWLYGLLFFVPDISFAAYGAGPRAGALGYNALHTTAAPALLAGVGLFSHQPFILGVSAIWLAHIGFDRMLGYGLKYASGFGHTHLGRIGRAKAAA